MYHKVSKQKGKEWSYYICSRRYQFGKDGCVKTHQTIAEKEAGIKGKEIFHEGCSMPVLGARGGEYSADGLIAWMVEEKFKKPGFLDAVIAEALAALNTDETRRSVQVAENEVKDLERKRTNFENAIGNASNETVINSLVKKLEAIDTDISAAKTKLRTTARDAARQIDPKAEALRIRKVFEGFCGLPVSEQKALLNEHVKRLDYVEPSCAGDISAMFNVTMKINSLQHSNSDTPS
jgi:hypothetical protein